MIRAKHAGSCPPDPHAPDEDITSVSAGELLADRSRGFLLWLSEPTETALREGLARERGVTVLALEPGGGLPAPRPRLDDVLVVTDWERLARAPGQIGAWRRALRPASVGVLVLARREDFVAVLDRLRVDEIDDVVEWPGDSGFLTFRVLRALRAVAAQAAADRLRSQLTRQVVDLQEFNRVALALSAERDVNRLLELILSKCREVTNADAGSLYLVEEKTPDPVVWEGQGERILRFVVAQNDSKHLDLKTARLPLDRASIAGYVALTRTPLNVKDVYHLPAGVEYTFNPAMDRGLGYRTISMLVIPMVDHTNEVIGVVQVINRKRAPDVVLDSAERAEVEVLPFGAEDQELVTSLASLAAVALNKALLITRIEGLLEGIVRASVTAIEQRDPATAGHSDRVARFTIALAKVVDRMQAGPYREVTFTPEELKELEYASILHDIGKVGVREPVLLKAKKLFDTELSVIGARFDFIKRTLQYEYTRRMMEVLIRLGPDQGRAAVKQLEEELERRLAEVDSQVQFVYQVNEPTVLTSEVSASLAGLAQRRYTYFDGTERAYLSDVEFRSLAVPRGSLNEEERLEIESHVTHSFRFLMQIPWTKELRRVPLIAYSHHERLDGTGYPRRVRELAVPIQARMMAISDIFDALTAADRPYKKAVSVDRALDILGAEAKSSRIDAPLLGLFVEAKVYETRVPRRAGLPAGT
jgi:HD-GYP domain-containing protein (c-di-GMP phosphodiesterase class II)